ncbi:Rossmann-like and DUF2520 domain-containing protein [Acinetobacter rathckeae]|uniref:Rossmann-like and DUF2520 domain-containing protein n=1 Tax=Acinetobacter rathckeae TaxID=2605272 RepID=UPI0018A2D34D|nr:Rossmann-like and DUF2520 domain-containing protein [Acinetobacter rathckeae]MBF7687543.1 DUF2520 domain-containing protein [Acinetobacter rathckeae]MBF7694945.1 DUF2520 domain-containing protein [Acinetobacter rathckeae]
MRISVVGAGRVATHLALVLKAQGYLLVDICSRQQSHAEQLAQVVGARALTDIHQLNTHIDLLMIAVTDQAIESVTLELEHIQPDFLVVHTSGSTDLKVISERIKYAGVFYPLQTFSLGAKIDWSSVPIFIEANTVEHVDVLKAFAQQLSHHVYEYSSAQRLSLHLAAVFACNFSNYCYDVAQQIVQAQGVDFKLLSLLILATAQKATQIDPVMAQTGPAMRQDAVILQQHLAFLQQHMPSQAKMYQLLSEQIQHRHILSDKK